MELENFGALPAGGEEEGEEENVLGCIMPARKRIRHDYLEESLKRIHISTISSGQIRLQNDVNAFRLQCAAAVANNGNGNVNGGSRVQVRIDPRNALQLQIDIDSRGSFLLICDKRYPHRAPQVISASTRQQVHLPILRAWLPTYSLVEILQELSSSSLTSL